VLILDFFQLPLSGSPLSEKYASWRQHQDAFNSLSRDHTKCALWKPAVQKLSTPSLGITNKHVLVQAKRRPFNSLSRDHLGEPGCREEFDDLSTPSLGITICSTTKGTPSNRSRLSTPSLGITLGKILELEAFLAY